MQQIKSEKPAVWRINGNTCIDDVIINLNPNMEGYYSGISRLFNECNRYKAGGVYLKKPGVTERYDCKKMGNLLAIAEANRKPMDIRIVGLGKEAKKIALKLYHAITSGTLLNPDYSKGV